MNLVQARSMVHLQNSMNAKVNPDWLTAGNAWLRAVMVEGVEAIEHHGWKWWKKQERDIPQMQIEMVDIWHFMLSHIVEHFKGNFEMAAGAITAESDPTYFQDGVFFDGRQRTFDDLTLIGKLELLVGLAAANRISVPLFFAILDDLGMSHDELYRQYVGKNVLNFFRQDHGYKAGTYVKMWGGREDNVWLVEFMNALDAADPNFDVKLYEALRLKYDSLTAAPLDP